MSNTQYTASDANMLDDVAMCLVILGGVLGLAYFGLDALVNGAVVMWEYVTLVTDTITDWVVYLYGQFTFHFLSYDEGWV